MSLRNRNAEAAFNTWTGFGIMQLITIINVHSSNYKMLLMVIASAVPGGLCNCAYMSPSVQVAGGAAQTSIPSNSTLHIYSQSSTVSSMDWSVIIMCSTLISLSLQGIAVGNRNSIATRCCIADIWMSSCIGIPINFHFKQLSIWHNDQIWLCKQLWGDKIIWSWQLGHAKTSLSAQLL